MGQKHGQRGHRDHEHRDHVGHRPLPRLRELVEDPEREGLLLSRGEGGDHDLVEGQGKGQHPSGQEGRAQVGQEDVAEGLQRRRPEVHGRLHLGGSDAAEARDHVVVDHDDAERRVADGDGPGAEGHLQEAERRAQRDAGDDAGQGDGQDEEERERLPSEESRPVQGEGGERPQDEGEAGGRRGHAQGQAESGPDVGAVPGGPEPAQGESGRGEPERRILGGEAIEKDDGEGGVQEQDGRPRGQLQGQGRPLRGHRTPPPAWPRPDRGPSPPPG